MSTIRRRELILGAAVAPAAIPAGAARPPICLFSKHLAELNYRQLGRTLRDLGFDGVDLTVRANGHVLPERAAEDLPRAVEALSTNAVAVSMITTELVSAVHPTARPILSTAARLKVPYFKPGYWRYGNEIENTLANVQSDVRGLVDLAKQYRIAAGFHNHSGNVGLAIWDTREIIRNFDTRWIGYYFDMQHSTAEGGVAGWEVALRLAGPRIKMVAVKDFYWQKARGEWKRQSCRLGEGMVNVPKMLAILKEVGFCGPISLHQEYQSDDKIADIRNDLEILRKHINAAYGG